MLIFCSMLKITRKVDLNFFLGYWLLVFIYVPTHFFFQKKLTV